MDRNEKTSQKLLNALSTFVAGNDVLITSNSVNDVSTMRRYALSIFTVLRLYGVQERHWGLQLNGYEILFGTHDFDPNDQQTDKTYIIFKDS